MASEKAATGVRVSKRAFLSRVSRRSGLPLETVRKVYAAMTDELMDIVRGGNSLMLTGFGKFYPQPHHGHRVQFARRADGQPEVIGDYTVLKFSATRDVNRKLDEELQVAGTKDA